MTENRVDALREFIFNDLKEQESWKDETLESFGKIAFQTPNTLRLRFFGFNILKDLYEWADFQLDQRLTGRELLTLRDCVGWPYYLPANHSHIALFTIKQSFVLKLNGGDVKKWLKNLENKPL